MALITSDLLLQLFQSFKHADYRSIFRINNTNLSLNYLEQQTLLDGILPLCAVYFSTRFPVRGAMTFVRYIAIDD
jgi:hypothetical protein